MIDADIYIHAKSVSATASGVFLHYPAYLAVCRRDMKSEQMAERIDRHMHLDALYAWRHR